MKKLFLILTILTTLKAFAQPVQNGTSGSLTISNARTINSLNFSIPRYTDTVAANASKGVDTIAALIYTYSGQKFWIRKHNPKRWEEVSGVNENIANTNLRLTGNRSLSAGAGASNGYRFTYDSLASLNLTRKADGLDYFYIGQDGNLILSNDVGEVLNIGTDGALNLSNKNDAFDANISRVELSAGSDTATFNFKARTKIKAEKVNPNNGSSYKILVRNDASNEVEYVEAVNVDTTVLATKAYVNYKDDIQQGFIDMRKLDSDTSRWKGYTTRERTQQQLDSTAALLARLAAVNIFTTRNTFNGALFGNKDSIPISTTNQWILAIDTVTGAITRINRIAAFVPNPDTTITGNYTLTQRDLGRSIYCTNTSLITITIPTGLTTGITLFQDRRYNIGVYQEGTGNGLVQFAGSGVTLQSTEGATKTRVANSYAEIKFKSDTVVKLVGDII